MIKVNLVSQKRTIKLPKIFNKVSWKGLILVAILSYIPEYFVYNDFDTEKADANSRITTANKKLKRIKKEIKSNGDVKRTLDRFNEQVENLRLRSELVEKIIKEKTNPDKLLERIARNVPEDMWFDEIGISATREINVKGRSLSYKSIGSFILQANESSYFGKSLNLHDYHTDDKIKDKNRKRVEVFEIKGRISTFDPWDQ